MPEKYATSAKSALMVVMLANREVPNVELKDTYKISLLPKDRDVLNRDKLLETLKEAGGTSTGSPTGASTGA
ncbi:hypothetical protein [Lentzea flava]|uniref:Uncharacterized protein n=1 Tax=Lentzea flava TaxID=103732 RepID=A0ABQ2UKR1_9PSEU|nr:hypothetical protein [Lentzea flava]MCP2199912.1 hypothetical protein [Lentzea flava]GGU40014.1 hypothetical protein GCM10010178_35500 [Lentzea flava]